MKPKTIERNNLLKKEFTELRKKHSAGKSIDILADKYKMQFDNIRGIVYSKTQTKGGKNMSNSEVSEDPKPAVNGGEETADQQEVKPTADEVTTADTSETKPIND